LIPIGVPISILSLIITYYIEKYLLITRHSLPPQTSASMVREMTDFYLEMYVLAFMVGWTLFEYEIHDEVNTVTLVGLIISLVFFIFPVHILF